MKNRENYVYIDLKMQLACIMEAKYNISKKLSQSIFTVRIHYFEPLTSLNMFVKYSNLSSTYILCI